MHLFCHINEMWLQSRCNIASIKKQRILTCYKHAWLNCAWLRGASILFSTDIWMKKEIILVKKK